MRLGVDYRRVRVEHGRTDRIAFGMGAFASRVTVMTGEATRLAAVEVRAKAIDVGGRAAAAARGRARADRRRGGAQGSRCRAVRDPRRGRQGLEPASKLRGTRAPGLSAEGWFYSDHMNYPYGVHIAVVQGRPRDRRRDDRALHARL
jgi:carbon-monoxide dehydrogenase large subunit/6-hydroxypseudooxynicotine dehydrogenase subunit gamma